MLTLTSYTTLNACGAGLEETLSSLRAGRSGLTPCDFEDAGLGTYIGRVPGVEDHDALLRDARLAPFDCRNNRLAHMALQLDGFAEAVRTAAARYGPDRIGVILGTSTSGVGEGEHAYQQRESDSDPLPDSFRFDETHDFYSLPHFVSSYLGLSGPNMTVSAACASSSKVFADAWQWIETGFCDAAVVGGVDSLCLLTLLGFNALELLSDGPCRPNDINRSGLSIGEAAGFALIERVPAPPEGAIILQGYGESSDAHHMSAPHPDGVGAIKSMQAALTCAGLAPREIDYINLHGTGSRANDTVEDAAIHQVFGDAIRTSSTKGWTGHALGAAGITEAVLCCLSLEAGLVPQNLLLERLDPALKCRVVSETAAAPLRYLLSNSFGFGGSNCTLIFARRVA